MLSWRGRLSSLPLLDKCPKKKLMSSACSISYSTLGNCKDKCWKDSVVLKRIQFKEGNQTEA